MMVPSIVEDTICAIATPIGEGGIGIVRMSGPRSLGIALELFRPANPARAIQSHRLIHGWIHNPSTGERVDEVLLAFMAGPSTYTREDVVEINCHSGFAVLNFILDLLLGLGARLAEPGEFTRRAFLNGRIDLSQAEAVADVIHSRSQQSLLAATRHLKGGFREEIERLCEKILSMHSQLEALIDFADDLEDEPAPGPFPDLHEALVQPIDRLLAHYESGRILREGLSLVLAGKPNVGKSSLLNALVGSDRAIVTPSPGTTRDVVEESFILSGVCVRVLDTAGIRHEPDEIEAIGIARTLRCVTEADAALWVVDGSSPLSSEDDLVLEKVRDSRLVVVINKRDLPSAVADEEIELKVGRTVPVIRLSALNPSDVSRLKTLLGETFVRRPVETSGHGLVPNLRQKGCLEAAKEALIRAEELLAAQAGSELVSIELHEAREKLEAILGRERQEDLLDRIFSRFCIGK